MLYFGVMDIIRVQGYVLVSITILRVRALINIKFRIRVITRVIIKLMSCIIISIMVMIKVWI